jgi:hypothetical protein
MFWGTKTEKEKNKKERKEEPFKTDEFLLKIVG